MALGDRPLAQRADLHILHNHVHQDWFDGCSMIGCGYAYHAHHTLRSSLSIRSNDLAKLKKG